MSEITFQPNAFQGSAFQVTTPDIPGEITASASADETVAISNDAIHSVAVSIT